jgi:hypothetical protein
MTTSTVENSYAHLQGPKWSPAEKAIASKQELDDVIQHTKTMVGVKQPSDLWEVEYYLTQRRKEMDRQYDYRYSVLTMVFGDLVRSGCLPEASLQGLRPNKLKHVRPYTKAQP